jgi:hypothetical protein
VRERRLPNEGVCLLGVLGTEPAVAGVPGSGEGDTQLVSSSFAGKRERRLGAGWIPSVRPGWLAVVIPDRAADDGRSGWPCGIHFSAGTRLVCEPP